MIERKEGPTPGGGVASEAVFMDARGRPVDDKSKATRVIIRELDAQDGVIAETFADLGK